MNKSANIMRLVIDGPRPGAVNMARDEALALCHYSDASAILRAYMFSPPAVTIGRFQKWPGAVDLDSGGRHDIDVVRRPTGGLAIMHLNDFTYSVVIGMSGSGQSERDRVFSMVAGAIVTALEELGIEAEPVSHRRRVKPRGDWCFESMFGVDLEWRGRKICGSAQRLIRSSILQHGSLFLLPDDEAIRTTSAATDPWCPGNSPFVTLQEATGRIVSWEEVLGAFRLGFERSMEVALEPGTLSDLEVCEARRLVDTKYSRREWLFAPEHPGRVRGL